MPLDGMLAAAVLLLAPFLGGGAYSLHRRFGRHDEFPLAVEAGALAVLALFYAIEIYILRLSLQGNPIYLVFAVLGLVAAGAALYGHMAVSLASRLVVDVVSPTGEGIVDRPRFGPAEALERRHDYEDALNEYLVIARIYPKVAEVHARVAENLLRLNRAQEAETWWRRALKYATAPAEVLAYTNRLCETYERHLGNAAGAAAILDAFVKRYPDLPDTKLVREHWERLRGKPLDAPHAAREGKGLELLSERSIETETYEINVSTATIAKLEKLGEVVVAEEVSLRTVTETAYTAPPGPVLTPLEAEGIADAPLTESKIRRRKAKPPSSGLSALDASPIEETRD